MLCSSGNLIKRPFYLNNTCSKLHKNRKIYCPTILNYISLYYLYLEININYSIIIEHSSITFFSAIGVVFCLLRGARCS